MKIQRKLLTESQKQAICDTRSCDNCPLAHRSESGVTICWKRVEQMKQEFEQFWNSEIYIEV